LTNVNLKLLARDCPGGGLDVGANTAQSSPGSALKATEYWLSAQLLRSAEPNRKPAKSEQHYGADHASLDP